MKGEREGGREGGGKKEFPGKKDKPQLCYEFYDADWLIGTQLLRTRSKLP